MHGQYLVYIVSIIYETGLLQRVAVCLRHLTMESWLLDNTILITWTDAGIIQYWVILFTIGVISESLSTFFPHQSLIMCE